MEMGGIMNWHLTLLGVVVALASLGVLTVVL